MPSTICTPIIGLLRKLAFGLFLSVSGRPVLGSLGSLSAAIVPHKAPPQLAMRIVALPPSLSQEPLGSAAAAAMQLPKIPAATAPARRTMNIVDPPFPVARRLRTAPRQWPAICDKTKAKIFEKLLWVHGYYR